MVNHSFTQNIGTRVQVWKFKNSNIWGLQIIQWQQVWFTQRSSCSFMKIYFKNQLHFTFIDIWSLQFLPTFTVDFISVCMKVMHESETWPFPHKSPKIILDCSIHCETVWKCFFFFLMSDVGETEYLHLRYYTIKLAPENTGFYFSCRENEMLPVLVKYFGNFCTKIEWQNSARWFNSEKLTLFTGFFLCSQSGTVAAVCLFNIQEAKKKWLAGQFHSHGSDRESFLPEAPCWVPVIILNISQTDSLDICLKGCY